MTEPFCNLCGFCHPKHEPTQSPPKEACPRCTEPTRKVPWSPYVEGFDKGVDEGEWRALLERDIADVAYHLPDLDRHRSAARRGLWHKGAPEKTVREWQLWILMADDCEAWLTRARAVLG